MKESGDTQKQNPPTTPPLISSSSPTLAVTLVSATASSAFLSWGVGILPLLFLCSHVLYIR